ncbi:type II toxin-antitoxin system RelE/ParE family toxin [Pedobacter sp. MR2016-19]|uniref:type II toxin-antitoxin system RelE/ParE family toxin n=1 Tax=Pedobacter sp. MR2016-19 TaxID=2780089 RepID=UPI0018746BE5|nr:type II toxin-antitoxin system RelE/ParE family toxin [Pedobacter sp. MR2016-19]MBE5318913.1 type II toxin-antitoxin system RelE/ParE family toxin [Pedobacter sp. MR2016-19]
MVVVWSYRARLELKKVFDYIALDSLKYAILVRGELIDLTIALSENPEKYPLDKYKINNDGSWRAFEKYRYRISYKITANQIRIVRLRHSSKSPLHY